MNKNPFIPQSTYAPPQPPLPPGPPPPPPTQTDYSAYWAAASAQQAGANAYNAQWNASQAARPSAEQSALYANYGYGPQNQWQRQQQQQQQQQQFHPPPQPLPPAAPPGYNPYQPAVGYSPYVPQVQPMAPAGYPMQQPQPVPMQPMFSAPMQQPQQQQQQQQLRQQTHHPSPQHLPPAKRQRFDGPQNQQNRTQPPTQPHFQLPTAPNQGMGSYSQPNRGGNPVGPSAGRGGATRGGSGGGRGARGVSMNQNRGGMSGRGRTGSGFFPSGNRGGALRGHNSRGNFGGGLNNRRGGGSFNMGSGNYQAGSARGRGQGHANRGGRHDGFGTREGSMSSSFGSVGKKDENKRTLTDFRIVGLEIQELSWSWGILPSSARKVPVKDEPEDAPESEPATETETRIGDDPIPEGDGTAVKPPEGDPSGGEHAEKPEDGDDADSVTTEPNVSSSSQKQTSSSGSLFPEPNELPSRIRIYFHTPVTAEDARPNTHSHPAISSSFTSSDSRKGKRKKLEDDDPDIEDGRAHRPPPPPHLVDDRESVTGSVATSVADTAVSEQDWLMAAIVEGQDEQEHLDEEDIGSQRLVENVPEFQGEDGNPPVLDHGEAGEVTSEGNATDVEMNDDEETGPSAAPHTDGNVDPLTGPVEHADESRLLSETHLAEQAEPSHDSLAHEDSALVIATPDSSLSSLVPLSEEVSSTHLSVSDALLCVLAPHPPSSLSYSETQTTDHIDLVETQVSEISQDAPVPIEIVDSPDTPPGLNVSALSATNGVEDTSHTAASVPEHLPEPPASPVLQSAATSVASPHAEPVSQPSPSLPTKPARTSSANRLSISYANGNRRLIVDAEVVDNVKVFRSEGRIEVTISAAVSEKDLKGIILEGLSETTHSYAALPPFDEAVDFDSTLPPFSKAEFPTTLTLIAYLDTSKPLSEAKWVKTGDIQDWLRSMFGRMFWVAGDAAEGWEKKITVVDPDPPPTIRNVLDSWATNSLVGAQNERERFVKTHMTEMDNLLEILLRLVRGERATSFVSGPTISTPSSIFGPLLAALSTDSAHGAQQTHVSLAVLAIFRLASEYAEKLDGEKGKTAVNESVGEIIRCIPSHLIYKSLDGIFKEWRTDKKGH